jgi:hypothetical protein
MTFILKKHVPETHVHVRLLDDTLSLFSLPNSNIMKVSILLTTFVLLSSIASSHSSHIAAELGYPSENTTTPTICSCSPTEFEFVLNLDQECTIVTKYRETNDDVQRQQGSDIFESNPGLTGSFCTVDDQNVVVPTAATDEGDDDEGDDAEDEPLRRRSLQGQWQWRTYTPTYSPTSEVVGEVMLRLGEEDIPFPRSSVTRRTRRTRRRMTTSIPSLR